MKPRVNIALLMFSAALGISLLAGCANEPRSNPNTGLSPDASQPPAFTQTPEATEPPIMDFSGERALQDVVTQVEFGPRTPGSPAHTQTVEFIKTSLEANGWSVEIQESIYQGQTVRNVVARTGSGSPLLLFGAHYDTRIYADHDPNPANHTQPVPGANDGASGVGVLLELGRVLSARMARLEGKPGQVWLVFFDAEDNGRIPGWDWIMGSRAFVDQLTVRPDATVIVDMIGDADLNAYLEKNSTPELRDEIWGIAAGLGYGDQIINELKYGMTDDHTPFLNAGLPAVDMIDFDYPYWHTVDDTVDKVAPASLEVVGNTLVAWIELRLGLPGESTP
ncbi:MAG TPA: M28 family peptidase [Anaerolineales bacterium]|nr:M28 family peptidase [Anaerolineales bacterium]